MASARCCRRRGEDANINIRWEVGGVRVTKGESRGGGCERGEPLLFLPAATATAMVVTAAATKAAARALEGAAFVATHGAGEEGGGRDNQHYVGGGRGATKGRVEGWWQGDDDVRVLGVGALLSEEGGGCDNQHRWEVGGGRWEGGA